MWSGVGTVAPVNEDHSALKNQGASHAIWRLSTKGPGACTGRNVGSRRGQFARQSSRRESSEGVRRRSYVAGQIEDTAAVVNVQQRVVSAGHELTHDWTKDLDLTEDYASRIEESTQIAKTDLGGVMDADAVLVLASSAEPGRGLFVELGAAIARAELGLLDHVVVVGAIQHETVFYFHPRVRRVGTIHEWLALIAPDATT